MSGSNDSRGLRESVSAHFLPVLLSSLAFALFAALLRNRIPNLMLYAAACLLFFAVFFAASLAGRPLLGRLVPESRSDHAAVAVVILTATLIMANFFREGRPDQGADFNESLFRYKVPVLVWFLLVAVTTAACCLLVKGLGRGGRRPLLRLLISLPYICLLSCTVWVPNIFYSHYTFFHAHPYYSPIYDVLNLAPLGELNTPFYGHYAIFFLLPCKLMGLLGIQHNIAAATVLATCNVVTLLAVLYCVDKSVKNDGIFIIALLSLGDVYLMYVQKLFYIKDVYLQTIPHRVMFPALACALMTAFSGRTLGKGRVSVLYALAALSFLWSTEIGLVCIASVSLYVFLRRLDFASPLSLANLRLLVICAALALASVLSAWLLVSAYDFAVSGKGVPFMAFMYPMIGPSSSIAVKGPLPDLLRTWLPVTLFLLAATGICAVRLLESGEKGRAVAPFCMSVLALGLLSYFMNNPVQINLTIVFFQVIILLAILLDFILSGMGRFRAGKVLSVAVIAVMSVFVLGNAGMKEVLSDRRATAWKARGLAGFAKTLGEEIPEGTLAFGWGVSDLFAAASRDTGMHVLDWVNIMYDKNPVFLEHANGLVEGADSFFAYEESVPMIPAGKDFVISREYEYMGWKFALYTRK